MQKAPNWFNTKQDIENSMQEYPQETTAVLADLLQDRFFWEELSNTGEYILCEDTTARLFLLGFSVQEAESLLPPGVVITPPAPPVPYYAWNSVTHKWGIDKSALEMFLTQAKKDKHVYNDTAAERARSSGKFTLLIQGESCDFDTKDRTQTDLLTAFAVTSTGATYDGWITNNGVALSLTQGDVLLISQAFRENANVYSAWQRIYTAIEQANTLAELNSIVIDYSSEV